MKALNVDITTLEVNAIVNAANNALLGGGGVDGAIHRRAGPALLAECKKLNGCPTGAAKITAGYALPASYVIHTVGPIWTGGGSDEAALLTSCYRESLALATQYELCSVAIPAISCGVYGYPVDLASRIAVSTTREHLQHNELPERVVFACFNDDILQSYLREIAST